MELRPSYLLGRSWYAVFYLQWARGELEQGIAEARRALDGDPLSSYLLMLLACALCTAGRLDEAIGTARRAVTQDPESFIARWILGVSLGTDGRFEEAISTLETAAVMSGRHARALSSLVFATGRFDLLNVAVAAAVLMAVGAVAVLPAAQRAARTDPLSALRSE